MTAPAEISGLSHTGLQQFVLQLLAENAEQKRVIAELREEIARLKGLKGRPDIKPSGMENGTTPKPRDARAGRRGRGKVTPRGSVEPIELPWPAACRLHRLRGQRCRAELHARPSPRRARHRPPVGTPGQAICRPRGLA